MIYRSRAPLRISFAGGGTDVSPYPETRGGAVLSTAIDMYAYATARTRTDGLVGLVSHDVGARALTPAAELPGRGDPLSLLAAAVRAVGAPPGGVHLSVRSQAPPGSGLGSSSSVTVAALGALSALRGQTLEPAALAELAYRVERHDCEIAGGRQDQYAAAYGGFNYIEFTADGTVVRPIEPPRRALLELQHNLLLCHTGMTRTDRNIIANQRQAYLAGERQVSAALDSLKELAAAMRDCVEAGELTTFAQLLTAGWQHKRHLAQGITDARIDGLLQAAIDAGALGGKLLGAGGGGYILLYCRDDAALTVSAAVSRLGGSPVRFEFAQRGLETWSPGA